MFPPGSATVVKMFAESIPGAFWAAGISTMALRCPSLSRLLLINSCSLLMKLDAGFVNI